MRFKTDLEAVAAGGVASAALEDEQGVDERCGYLRVLRRDITAQLAWKNASTLELAPSVALIYAAEGEPEIREAAGWIQKRANKVSRSTTSTSLVRCSHHCVNGGPRNGRRRKSAPACTAVVTSSGWIGPLRALQRRAMMLEVVPLDQR